MRTSAGNPDAVDESTRHTLVTVDHPVNPNHNGGQLQVGFGGMLYAATGDGGSGNDPPGNAQNPLSRLGKVLRIDPDSGATEIYASGLRNPWRFSFDRATGDLIIGDVGQNAYEEVDFAPRGYHPGANYGWRCYEGFHRTGNACAPLPTNPVPPVLEKDHSTDGYCAIVGGYVVRDPALTSLTGRYVYGDNCASAIRSAKLVAPPARVTDDRGSELIVNGLTSFGEDSCGHVYAVSGGGPVYRLDDDTFTPCSERHGPVEPGTPPDTRAPSLSFRAPRVQRVLRHRGVRISLRCDELCGVSARAKMQLGHSRKRYKLKPLTRQLAADDLLQATLRMTRRQRRRAARALRHHRRVRFFVKVVARDAAGNSSRKAKTVRARR